MMILQKGNLDQKETKPKKSKQKYQLERQLTEKNYQLKQPTTQPTQPTNSKSEAKIENFQRETSTPTNPTNQPERTNQLERQLTEKNYHLKILTTQPTENMTQKLKIFKE